ncbi:MAG: VapE domain-containing protein [Neglectibacter sp.]
MAGRDEWFSDDLKSWTMKMCTASARALDYRMSEMIATANAKSIEEIKSFLSRQKETYKVPYETHPADRPAAMCIWRGRPTGRTFCPVTAPAMALSPRDGVPGTGGGSHTGR